jgi:PAS domain S-box-containing protein
MSAELFERYKDLQAYVGWSDEDAARVKVASSVIHASMDRLVDDFYAEIRKHPETLRVITGGESQIASLMGSLKAWLSESLTGRSDVEYVTRRWYIGLRHAEIGLNPAYTSAAMSRLRNGIVDVLAGSNRYSPTEFQQLVKSFNKLLDLDLSVIQDAYQAEYLRQEKLAEHERSEIKFSRLVEAEAGMVIILRDDATIAYFSPFSEKLTGFQQFDVLGKSFLQLFLPDTAHKDVLKAISDTLAGESAAAFETPLLKRDGNRRWFAWNARRLEEYEGGPAVLAVGHDFTERRDAHDRMLRSERLAGIGQMITGIAHESRNALQRIQSCTEMLELEVESNTEAQRLLRRLQEAQDNLLRLFDEVRNFAAPIQLEKANVQVDAVWREAWESLSTLRRGREAVLSENCDKVDLRIEADRFRLVQVFRNLLENSLAACSDPVVIQVECCTAQLDGQPALEVRVHDNGPGLSAAVRQSVFEPFYTTKTKGTGLGMAIARRIIEAHGGQITVGNNRSSGAEFVLILKRASV